MIRVDTKVCKKDFLISMTKYSVIKRVLLMFPKLVTQPLQSYLLPFCLILLPDIIFIQYRKAYFTVKAENEELKMQIEDLKKKLASMERRATYKRH